MTMYIIKLFVMLPLMGGLIYGALWLYRKYQPALMQTRKEQSVTVLESQSLGGFAKLTVIEFEGEKILLSVSRTRVDLLAKSESKQ